jgi:hypothetical protein
VTVHRVACGRTLSTLDASRRHSPARNSTPTTPVVAGWLLSCLQAAGDGPIDAPKTVADVRKEPYALPDRCGSAGQHAHT